MAIDLTGGRRQQLCDWLTANRINPNVVPEDADLTIIESDGARHIRYEAYATTDDGHKVANERGTDAAIDTRTVPLLVEPPAWWQPCEKPTREQAIEQRDGAYRERAQLLAWVAAMHPDSAVITPATDLDDAGWSLLFFEADGQQMSWHIAPSDASLFTHVRRAAPGDPRVQWDGHTTEEKYGRIRDHVRRLTTGER